MHPMIEIFDDDLDEESAGARGCVIGSLWQAVLFCSHSLRVRRAWISSAPKNTIWERVIDPDQEDDQRAGRSVDEVCCYRPGTGDQRFAEREEKGGNNGSVQDVAPGDLAPGEDPENHGKEQGQQDERHPDLQPVPPPEAACRPGSELATVRTVLPTSDSNNSRPTHSTARTARGS